MKGACVFGILFLGLLAWLYSPNGPRPQVGTRYWALVGALLVIGFVTMFSFGAPLTVLGLLLAGLSPYRNRPRIFWPPIVALVGFVAGFIATAVTVNGPEGAQPDNTFVQATFVGIPIGVLAGAIAAGVLQRAARATNQGRDS